MARSLKVRAQRKVERVSSVSSFTGLRDRLKTVAREAAEVVAKKSAPGLTNRAQNAYSSGRTVYDDTRPASVDGAPLTLYRSGRAQAGIRFQAVGTQVRCRLGERYVPYLIGRYRILPNGPLPSGWSAMLRRFLAEAEL